MDYAEFKTKFNISLNEQQEAAVQKVQGPVLVLAVPGSGKTTVLVTRLGYMLNCNGISPNEILTMTYTIAATRDMRERFCSMFGDRFAKVLEFRTINGVCARIIQYYERTLGRTAFGLITDERKISAIIGEIYRKSTSEFAMESDIKAIRTQITYIKNMMLTDEEIENIKLDDIEISPIYREYCRVLREQKWMDYDDQMVYVYQILRQYPEILRHFHQKYHYLCVDEAQDTSKIQHMLIRQLADAHHNLFMVGDEDQSIYGFRAAYPQALMEFETVYPEATVLLMEKNYRSTRQIVEQADRFIRQNKNRRQKHMVTDNGEGAPIRAAWVTDRKEQYRFIAKLARDCQTETAVLYRDNDSALPIIDILNREGIGYRSRQVDSLFFSNHVVRDITDIIRFAIDPTDGERFLHIYYKFGAGISKAQATTAVERASVLESAVLDELLGLDLSQWAHTQVKALQTHLANLSQDTAEKAVYRIVHFMGYGSYLEQREADQSRISILESLAAQVQTPEELLKRLDDLCDIVKSGSTDPQSPFILSTIHSSKGLEYERVILADVVDGIIPKTVVEENLAVTSEKSETSETVEEERRLFYVAMTRAKREVVLVRFKRADLPSSFAKFLFPPHPKPSSVRPVSSSKLQYRPASPAAIPNHKTGPGLPKKNYAAIAKEYFPQTRVWHKAFGPGIITERDGRIVTIRFDDGFTKQFDLIVALQAEAIVLRSFSKT